MPSLFSDHMMYSHGSKPAQCLTNGKILLKIIENFNVLKNLQSSPTGSLKCLYLACTAPCAPPPHTLPFFRIQPPVKLLKILSCTFLQYPRLLKLNGLYVIRFFPHPISKLPNTIGLHKPVAAHPSPGIHAEVRNGARNRFLYTQMRFGLPSVHHS